MAGEEAGRRHACIDFECSQSADVEVEDLSQEVALVLSKGST